MLSRFSISAGSALKRPAVRECSEAAAGLSAGWARFGGCGATWGAGLSCHPVGLLVPVAAALRAWAPKCGRCWAPALSLPREPTHPVCLALCCMGSPEEGCGV